MGNGGTGKFKGVPRNLEVELSSQPGVAYKYFPSEFGEDGSPPLELAYAITVHKSQGSEFGRTVVILPEPCPVLSREMLYTALTRQRERVTLLYQGEIAELLRYLSRDQVAAAVAPEPRFAVAASAEGGGA